MTGESGSASPRPEASTRALLRVKRVFLLCLVLLVLVLEYSYQLLAPYLGHWSGRVVLHGVLAVATLFLFGAFYSTFDRLQARLERRNRELLALHRAALDIYGELALDAVLEKVVDQARQLLEARYGAIAVIDDVGNVDRFVTSGISDERRQRIGEPPRGKGLLGVGLHEGQSLRIPRMGQDPRAVGFPAHHPKMESLLAVPIVCSGPFRGNLYVTEKETGAEFSAEDEQTLVRFATAAAIAVDNADLHQRLRTLAVAEERVRIAREMHDGMAQVLAYVNTKAQAVQEFLRRGKSDAAAEQLEQLAAAAREVYTDVREGILALRTPMKPGGYREALEQFIQRWQQQSEIEVELEIDGDLELPPTIELQVLRIIQEGLANIRKHSGANTATVICRQIDQRLLVEIADDGEGFDPEARQRRQVPRFGLAIMRERAESIGGRLSVDSSPGSGTRVRLELSGIGGRP